MGTPGTVKVLLSSKGYSSAPGQHMSLSFGELGDVPVPYMIVPGALGLGRPSAVFYQPGNGLNRNNTQNTQGFWRWCPTSSTPTSTTCTVVPAPRQFGERSDVPLPGMNFDGVAATAEVAVYRPGIGRFIWDHVGGGAYDFRNLGGPGAVPLPGFYDGDNKTDLAVYRPNLATFQLLRSEQNWDNLITRSTNSQFVPNGNGGSSAARSGALPLDGMYANLGSVPRRVFSLFYPHDGTWNTLWTPLSNGNYTPCPMGWGSRDIPIAGIDRDGDGKSDMVVLRLPGTGSGENAQLHIRGTATGSGCGTTTSVTLSLTGTARLGAFAVGDMTGDGKPEILITEPRSGWLFWLKSEENYATAHFFASTGSERAVLF